MTGNLPFDSDGHVSHILITFRVFTRRIALQPRQVVDQVCEHVVLSEKMLLNLHCLVEHRIGIVVGRLGRLLAAAASTF